MSILFEYPKKATFGRVLPKTKIYERGRPSTKVKELFVHQVEQIVWKYKLAPETINIRATKSVPEIQIFNITLKTGELKEDVLRCIDKAIPFPILYEIYYNGKCRAVSAYKRPSEADAAKWVVSSYFESGWLAEGKPRKPLPIALNLGALYEELLSPLIPYAQRNKAKSKESLQERVERAELINARQQELTKTETRLRKEKQFNRKVEINADIRAIKTQLKELKGAVAVNKGK
jgi:Domain of unknown function (DUF4391)